MPYMVFVKGETYNESCRNEYTNSKENFHDNLHF